MATNSLRDNLAVEDGPEVSASRATFFSTFVGFSRHDWKLVLGLSLYALCLNLYGVWALEFFRHTEADRSLIGWEMLQSGEFLVPHLLGSVILTCS